MTKFALVVGCIGLIAGVYGSSALSSAPSSKWYSATISSSPPPAQPGSSTTVQAGVPTTFYVTIRDCAAGSPSPCDASHVSNTNIGAARITFDSGFTLGTTGLGVKIYSASGSEVTSKSAVWTATLLSGSGGSTIVQIANTGSTSTGIAPGEYAVATIPTTGVPTCVVACSPANPHTVTTDARQSNQFSGRLNTVNNVDGDPTIKVIPGPLAKFVFDSIGALQPSGKRTIVAGANNSVSVRAYDAFNNFEDVYYNGSPSLSSALNPSSTGSGTGCSGIAATLNPPHCTPTATMGSTTSTFPASLQFTNGAASFSFTAYNAETDRSLTLNDISAGVTSPSNLFDVVPATAIPTFTTQPTEVQVSTPQTGDFFITPAPVVHVHDVYGNTISGAHVTMGLTPVNIPGASFTGSFTNSSVTGVDTNSSGDATFSQLAINGVGFYKLVASAGTNTDTSVAFTVADVNNSCSTTPGTCHNADSIKNKNSIDVTADGTLSTDSLGVLLIEGPSPPDSVCGTDFTPLGAASYIDVTSNGATSFPTLTINFFWDKALLQTLAVTSRDANHRNVCIGSVNLRDPQGFPGTQWPTKSGGSSTSVFDDVFNVVRHWGLAPDIPAASCADPAVHDIAIINRFKMSNGTVGLTLCVKPNPAPGPAWDPHGFGG